MAVKIMYGAPVAPPRRLTRDNWSARFDSCCLIAETTCANTELRKFNSNRGSKHFIYMNRTFFGLYNLMFDLKANAVKINQFQHYK